MRRLTTSKHQSVQPQCILYADSARSMHDLQCRLSDGQRPVDIAGDMRGAHSTVYKAKMQMDDMA